MNANEKKVLAGVAAVFLAATLTAAKADPGTFYLGADLVQLKTKIDDKTGVPPIISGTASATTLRLKGGGHLTSWLDLEAQAVLPKAETFSTAGTTNTAKTSVFALFAKPKLNLGPASLYGLIGESSASIEMSGVVSGKKTTSGFAYGAGAQYTFTPNLAASLEYTQYNKKNLDVNGLSGGLDVNVSAIGAGITYTF